MLPLEKAIEVFTSKYSDLVPSSYLDYDGKYIFLVSNRNGFRNIIDPWYYVDKETGFCSGYPILTNSKVRKFMQLKGEKL